ncbi:hypothetical protein SAMN04487770_12613 [Butyrivibrio sp. ob235]|uniref:hypothetical protein n=1 Tax=Butyrivibrio sp. ob235 TaxID=1761780 RepID=UPI0008C4DAB0|nr:hypothetical protein [Butyrivibrio sp. ob235]SEM10997.1 hypothetical protein SAMN04487770_12613 [Butyrivibrio sp. ob235]
MKNLKNFLGMQFVMLAAVCSIWLSPLDAKAVTLPIGEGEVMQLNKVIKLEKGIRNNYYTMTIPSSGRLTFHTISDRIQGVEIRDKDNNSIFFDDSNGWYKIDDFTRYLRAGQYSVRVCNYYCNDYAPEFTFYFTPENESFPETETVNNDIPETASIIPSLSGTVYTGMICSGAEKYDWYKFTAPSTCDVKLVLTSLTDRVTPNYLIQDGNGNYVADGSGSDEFAHSLNAGTYYLRIGSNYAGIYTFQLKSGLSTDVSTVKLNKIKAKASKKGKVSINWNKITDRNIAGYEIEISDRKAFYSTIKKCEAKGTANSKKITIPKQYRGKKVFVRIRAYSYPTSNEKKYSDWSKVASVKVKR